jgi:hypothetical protein
VRRYAELDVWAGCWQLGDGDRLVQAWDCRDRLRRAWGLLLYLFGLRQAWLHARRARYSPPPFTERGL